MNQNLTEQKQKALLSTKKARGTLNKVFNLIELDTYCPDIIQQIDSVIGLLASTKKQLITGHLNHSLEGKLSENKNKTITELLKMYNLK